MQPMTPVSDRDVAVICSKRRRRAGVHLLPTTHHHSLRSARLTGLRVKLYVPFARPALTLMHRLRGNFFVNSYVKANSHQ